jgi:hypothetical protein
MALDMNMVEPLFHYVIHFARLKEKQPVSK